jgi:hypothetical protein
MGAQLQQYIAQNNWEGIALFLKENIGSSVAHFNMNLNTSTFVAQLSVHTLNELTQDMSLIQQQENIKCQELEKGQIILKKKAEELEKELQQINLTIVQTNEELKVSKSKLQTLTSRLTAAKQNLTDTKQFLEESSIKLKQWKERLHDDLVQWTCDDVAFLLKEIDMAHRVDLFLENKIDGSVIAELSTSDLMNLKLTFTETKQWLKAVFLIQNYKDMYIAPPGILQWNTDTVCTWLEDNKFAHLVPVFRQHQVTGGELAFIDRQDLKEHLKIGAMGDCIRLEKAIKELTNAYLDENLIKKQLAAESDEEKMTILHVSHNLCIKSMDIFKVYFTFLERRRISSERIKVCQRRIAATTEELEESCP